MIFKINGKDEVLRFDIGFIRKLDGIYKTEVGGMVKMDMGSGLSSALAKLESKSPVGLSDIIYSACKNQAVKPSQVDYAIELYAEENNGDLEPLFEEVINCLGESPLVQGTIKTFEANLASDIKTKD